MSISLWCIGDWHQKLIWMLEGIFLYYFLYSRDQPGLAVYQKVFQWWLNKILFILWLTESLRRVVTCADISYLFTFTAICWWTSWLPRRANVWRPSVLKVKLPKRLLDVGITVLTVGRDTIIFTFPRSLAGTGRGNSHLLVNSILNTSKKSPANWAVKPTWGIASRSQCTGIGGRAKSGNKVWVKSNWTCKHMIDSKFSYWSKCQVRWE